MTRRLLSYAFPFVDNFEPLPQVSDVSVIDDAFQMDEDTFRVFYTRTAGMLWAYIARATNDSSAADDLLQEAYFRLLRSRAIFDSDEHRKNYLFRIATNLIRDRYRRPRIDAAQLPEHGEGDIPAEGDLARERRNGPTCNGRRTAEPSRAPVVWWPTVRVEASGNCRALD